MGDHYSLDQIQRALAPPTRTRIDTILDLIEKAKKLKDTLGIEEVRQKDPELGYVG